MTMVEVATPPLIFTLAMDDKSVRMFNFLRTAHFPPEINYINAHLTLFHQIPANQHTLLQLTREIVSRVQSFRFDVTGLQNLGRGVAYKISAAELVSVHLRLQELWFPHLSRQDQQSLRPHITIQNKVSPEKAKELFTKLGNNFTPFAGEATGVELHSYLGGRWRFEELIPFTE